MGSDPAKGASSQMVYPIILGAVSAFSVAILVSFIVAMYRNKCCPSKHTMTSAYCRIPGITMGKETKIAYDMPTGSNVIISSVWQQEENDIADEVRRTYKDISSCSKPVLFDEKCGLIIEQVNKTEMDSKRPVVAGVARKGKPLLEIACDNDARRKPFTKMANIMRTNFMHIEKHPQVVAGEGPQQEIPVKTRKEMQRQKTGITNAEMDIYVPDSTLAKVQNWVNNSFGDANTINALKKSSQLNAVNHDMPNNINHLASEEKTTNEVSAPVSNYIQPDVTVEEPNGLHSRAGGKDQMDATQKYSLNYMPAESNTAARKSIIRETDGPLLCSEYDTKMETKHDERSKRAAKFSDMTDFHNTENLKNLMLMRWIDLAELQNKSSTDEENLENTQEELSVNDLQYEDIESILTSVSRMDEKRLEKLKSTDFYKQLLLKKVRKQIAHDKPRIKEGNDQVVDIDNEATRDGGQYIMNTQSKGKSTSRSFRTAENQNSNAMLDTISKQPSIDIANTTVDVNRVSLSESTLQDDSSENTNTSAASENLFEGKYGKINGEEQKLTISSNTTNYDDGVLLKYSIVRNFSNRFKPLIYVSLTHLHGLECLYKANTLFRIRMYLSADKSSLQETEILECKNDIFVDGMFSIRGSSTKDILNDSLVIETVTENEIEAMSRVSIQLRGLRYKATLLATVAMEMN